MNKERRAEIARAIEDLRSVKADVESILMDEQSCLDSLPENLENSEMYSKMENACDELDSAMDALIEAEECLDRARE